MLSIIIPTFNEMKNEVIQKSFTILAKITDCEIIVVDSHSDDGTSELAQKFQFKVLFTDSQSRAVRLNIGIKAASFEKILLHHPRSILSIDGISYLKSTPGQSWGAFTHKFDMNSFLLRFTSFYSNYIRGARGIYYLDHCLFANKKDLEEIGYLAEIDIFEDTDLCLKLRQISPPRRLPFISLTSAIRFKKNGIWKHALLNQLLKIKYYLKVNHQKINQIYEKDLDLNSKYKDTDG